MLAIDKNVNSFLRQTMVAVLGTTNDDGTPHLTPIWYAWEDDGAHMITGLTSAKWRNLQARPYASLCVDRREAPYAAIILYGEIEKIDRPVYALIESLAFRYLGAKEGQEFTEAYKNHLSSMVAFKLTPNRLVQNLNP